jgi:hypothetical protein
LIGDSSACSRSALSGGKSMIRKSGGRFSEKDHAPTKISMIRKSGGQFSEKIMLKQNAREG